MSYRREIIIRQRRGDASREARLTNDHDRLAEYHPLKTDTPNSDYDVGACQVMCGMGRKRFIVDHYRASNTVVYLVNPAHNAAFNGLVLTCSDYHQHEIVALTGQRLHGIERVKNGVDFSLTEPGYHDQLFDARAYPWIARQRQLLDTAPEPSQIHTCRLYDYFILPEAEHPGHGFLQFSAENDDRPGVRIAVFDRAAADGRDYGNAATP